MVVSVLSISARGDDEVAVTLEIKEGELSQRETFLVSPRILADLRIKVGECDRESFDRVAEASEIYRAVKKGLSLLSFGRCSKRTLVRKLALKGFSKERAVEAVEELSRLGYIDEYSDAQREAERCVEKLWGEARIRHQLYEKGYTDDAVNAALYALEDNGVDFFELCAERLGRTVDSIPADPKDRQKLVATLIRYGFSNSQIREAVRNFKK